MTFSETFASYQNSECSRIFFLDQVEKVLAEVFFTRNPIFRVRKIIRLPEYRAMFSRRGFPFTITPLTETKWS